MIGGGNKMASKIRVGLVYGGKSGEHEVSLSTAFAVSSEFDFEKYMIKPFYISKEGQWFTAPFLNAPPSKKEELILSTQQTTGEATTHRALFSIFSSLDGIADDNQIDVMFPLLHGTFGEDGTIQGLFEMANIPYVGTGVLASSVGMDKVFMKKAFADAGLPQCKFCYFTKAEWTANESFYLDQVEQQLGYPNFVKPANLGSSVGISKASTRDELKKAIQYALRFDRKIIIEQNINAREIEVAVLGNDEPKASVAGEILSGHDFYDYTAKYTDGKSSMVIPAEIPDELMQQLRQMALIAYKAIDGTGLSRVDFFVEKDTSEIFINEVNTLPGFTPYSMYPLLWKETGLPYKQLLDELIKLAFSRHEAKQNIDYSGGSNA